MSPVTIRQLLRTDAPCYRAFRHMALTTFPQAFTSHADDEAEKPLAWFEDRIAPQDNTRHLMLGAFADGVLVAAAGVGAELRRNEAHKAHVFGVAVAADYHGQGIGKRLMSELVRRARRLPGVRQLHLSVSAHNEGAIALYRGMGFSDYGREPRATIVNDEPVDKLLMVLRLD